MDRRNKFALLPILLVLLSFYSEIPHSFALDVSRPTINADDVHQLGYTGEGVTVAIIDSGIDFNHPDFQGAIKTSWNIPDNNATLAQDTNGHGTHVAGVVAGRGVVDSDFLGIAPNAELVIVRITARSQIPQAIQWCIDNKDNYDISIITLSSWYQLGPCDGLCEACKKADDAIEKGIVFVKSAGNQWGGDITCPGSAFNIITVGASDDHGTVTTSDDTVADFSSHGPTEDGRPGLDIVAPGVNIIMPALGGGYASSSGTSFAAPHVAGLAALILEKTQIGLRNGEGRYKELFKYRRSRV